MLYKPICDIMHECAQNLTGHFNILNILLDFRRKLTAYTARFSSLREKIVFPMF